jgi:predicted transcriptional regulator of viral defense system
MSRIFTQAVLLKELAERGRLFTTEDALAVGVSVGGTTTGIEMALARLVRSGLVTRARRGLYVVSLPGMSPLHPFVIGSALVDGGVISGWAAVHHHGLTEQIPRVIEVTAPKRTRSGKREDSRRLIELDGERFHIVTVVGTRMFGIEEQWFGGERARIFDRERAVLDLFVRPGDFGGLETPLTILEEHQGDLKLERLVEHALKLGNVSVIKRVGWALEKTGSDVALEPLLDVPVKAYALLDPSRPARGPRRSRWHLRENLEPAA